MWAVHGDNMLTPCHYIWTWTSLNYFLLLVMIWHFLTSSPPWPLLDMLLKSEYLRTNYHLYAKTTISILWNHHWLVVWNHGIWIDFPYSWECHKPNCYSLSPWFFRGVGQPPDHVTPEAGCRMPWWAWRNDWTPRFPVCSTRRLRRDRRQPTFFVGTNVWGYVKKSP